MKKFISNIVASTLLFGSLSYAKDVYGEVNGQKITKEDIAMLLQNPSVEFEKLPKQTQTDILNNVAEKILLSQEALKSPILSSAEFTQALEKLKADLAFQFWLQEIGKQLNANDEEVATFYTKNKDKFANATKYKARHILVKAEEDAKKIIAELKKSKKVYDDFNKLAKDKTTDPSGKTNGGELGWFESNQMVPEFSEATSKLSIGSFSQTPVKTDYGYHVIYLEDKKEIEMAQVKQVLLREKFTQKIKQIASELKKTATIKIEN